MMDKQSKTYRSETGIVIDSDYQSPIALQTLWDEISRKVPSSRSLSRYEEQRHLPRSQSSYLLHPEELPQGSGSMHHRSSRNQPDQFMTRQTQEHNHQQYSAPPDQQYSQHADVGELHQTNHRVLQQQQHQHDDGPRGFFQSPYQASAQTTAAAQQMRLHPAYFGGMYHGNNLNQPGFASGRIIPLVAASAGSTRVSRSSLMCARLPIYFSIRFCRVRRSTATYLADARVSKDFAAPEYYC
jgi:hypothetical protein